MLVPKLEKFIGIEVYATKSLGIGGAIRQFVDDFVVEEVLVDGSKAKIDLSNKHPALGSSLSKNRYLLCALVKRDWDTFLAVGAVAAQLGISPSRIQIAGIKDAKAVTAQQITVERVQIQDIGKIQINDLKIRPIGYVRDEISPYFLLGNNFRITIRGINHPRSAVKRRIANTIQELESMGGTPNFFGHQRFGTIRPITHMVGKALVEGNFERAAMLFLAKPSAREHPESRRAREELQATQDFTQAIKDFPKKLTYERLMLKHLALKTDDFIGAFRRLPLKLRKLFPQAYQSYLFNKFLSRRIAHGIGLNKAEFGDYFVNVERNGLPISSMYKMASSQTRNEVNKTIKEGRVRVAFPLIGFKKHLSQGLQGEIERTILEEESIIPENFKIEAMPEISSRGELRTALAPLANFSLDEVTDDSANLSRRQAELSFMLHRGSYATIVLREIIKPRNLIAAGF